jgi:hypothetical protein
MEGLDLVRRGGVRNAIYHGSAGLIRLRLAQGEPVGAREVAEQFRQEAQAGQMPTIIRWAAAMQALVDLRAGDLAAAAQWARDYQPRPAALFFPTRQPSRCSCACCWHRGHQTRRGSGPCNNACSRRGIATSRR